MGTVRTRALHLQIPVREQSFVVVRLWVLDAEEYGFSTSRYYWASDTMSLHQSIPRGTGLFQKLTVTQHVKDFSPSVQSDVHYHSSKRLNFAVKDYRI